MHLRTFFLNCLILVSYLSFGQTDNELKENKHRYSIEPYVTTGLMNTYSAIDPLRFAVIPGLNVGMDISRKSTLLVGANYSQINGIVHHVYCFGFGFCPDAEDHKTINISLSYKYDALSKGNFNMEPFINIYGGIVFYFVQYEYHNKEYKQRVYDGPPFLGLIGFSSGAYLNYSVSNHLEVFAAPTFSYFSAYTDRYLVGSSFGTRITF